MVDATATRDRRAGRGALAAITAVACIGCCSIPFLAGLTIFGVALCSAKFLGLAFGATLASAATIALIAYRRRKQRGPVGPVPVKLGVGPGRLDEPQ